MIDIPNYEIGKLAGRGGIAEVYLARHKLLDRQVAIKLISPMNAGDLADKRFLKEAKVVAGLRHPNIVSIYDVGVYENKYYIIMEYLEGGDLKQNIQRTLPVTQALKIMRQIASALAHAHDKGFIHRDIKSQNIMFRGDGTAVLTDFGIVKDLAADTGYTMDGTSIGTPHYMSPEQAQGMGGIDWRTDLYSLGVTFYEMLTGSLPYTADSPIAVALKHIKDPVPELPEQFVRFQPIISRLMAKNPDDRYQSAHDLILAIDKLERQDRPDSLESFSREDAAPTYPFLMPQKFGRKVNLANVFLGVVIGCIVFGLGLFIQPYLADMLHREEAPVEKSQTQAGSPERPDVQAKKPSLLAGIKKRWTNTPDAEQITALIENKNYPEALDYILNARKALKTPPIAMVQKGDRLLESKQYQNAGDVYSTVLSVDSGNQSALLGLLYVVILKYQELANKEKATSAEYGALLALLNKGVETTGSSAFEYLKIETAESVFESANRQLAQNHFKEAGTWSETGLKYAPDHQRLKKLDYLIRARKSLGMADAARKEKNFTEALEWIKKARSISPEDADLQINEWLITGDMQAALGNFKTPENENALQYYQKVLAASPQNKEAAMRIAAMDVMMSLYQVRRSGPLSEKIPAYQTLFSNLKFVIAEHGEAAVADLKHEVMAQVKEDISAQKSRKKTIPAEFLTLASDQFPDEKAFFSSQYDILIAKGDESASKQEKQEEQDIKQLADVKAELAAQLFKIKQNQNITEKMGAYATLFKALNIAAKRHGSKKIIDIVRDVKAQVQADIQGSKTSGKLIPDEFITLLKRAFPELHKSAITAQYDILIGKGDKGASNQEAGNYYLKAMNLDKNRGEAKNKIELLVKDMENNGDASGAADLLNQATQILPNELIFAELSGKMESHIEVFATASGCGKANRITQALVDIESITICIYYKNLPADSVVNIVLQQKGGKTMEAPLILDGRSGNKAIDIMAPIEGFVVGEYTISVRQGGKILSETTIQLTPKRR